MRIAYVHVLPLEYYPPARNAIALLSSHEAWSVRAWTTTNRRGLPEWNCPTAEVSRPRDAAPEALLPVRMTGYTAWHLRTAVELARWQPDALISVEPHSTLAVWLYYKLFRGTAPLFIHHHEYYAPEDYDAVGMRILRATRRLESDLFQRAVWVSGTNDRRLELLLKSNEQIPTSAARTWPNYPRKQWVLRSRAIPRAPSSGILRLVYVGSASLDDTFIAEIAASVARHPDTTTLHVTGDNISSKVWSHLRSLNAANISLDPAGCDYEELPALLRRFDVGLVLYKGNTLNFVHNVPNKAIEYLAAGLEVWYAREMEGMRDFHDRHPALALRELNFSSLPLEPPTLDPVRDMTSAFPFTCEIATAPLVAELERLERKAVQ